MALGYFTEENLQALSKLDMLQLFGTVEGLPPEVPVDDRIAAYKVWIEANSSHPAIYMAYFNLGAALSKYGRGGEAKEYFERSIEISPDFYPSYINLGYVYEQAQQPDKAVGTWMSVVDRLPQISSSNIEYKLMALKQMARLEEGRTNLPAAEHLMRQSVEISASNRDIIQHLVVARQRQCKWPAVTPFAALSSEDVLKCMAPVSLAAYLDDPLLQLANAFVHNRLDVGWPRNAHVAGAWAAPEPSPKRPLRIGYLSSDYRHHAIGFLMAQIFELHDRSKVEIFVYDCGPHSPDYIQARIRSTVDHWININPLTDVQASSRISDDKIDILIDVNGYTNFARTSMLYMRPAPIIVNWLGYPGTMGSPVHNYIIADDYIIPPQYEVFYSERVKRLPCYQPNDQRRGVPVCKTTRKDAGLPDDKVVFCCFNGLQKITPVVFKCWMEVLRHVPDSVLWLLVGLPEEWEHFRRLAAAEGVDPARLVFAQWAMNADHLARYQLADIVLDTWPYGAHTTASDALWMGIPVVTLSGRGFASRVCGSLARAGGVPELVCRTQAEYITRAVTLGRDRIAIQQYKSFLNMNRTESVLFDTPKLVRQLETIYQEMWDEYARGDLPIPELNNLDVYQDIGARLHREDGTMSTDEEFFSSYLNGFLERHAFSPLFEDERIRQIRKTAASYQTA